MSDDDNVVPFPPPPTVTMRRPLSTVIVIRSDGVKLRGRDHIPLGALDRQELLDIIDQLCSLLRR